ncbi:MAG: LytR/AlgR family response regulator transcription factor [Lachnospiraceae bacterium]
MIEIAIVDDEREFADAYISMLQDFFKDFSMEMCVSRFESAERLLRKEDAFDLYFLDIEMPEMDGMRLAKKIREKYGTLPEIVFVTSKEMAVFDAFSVDAMGFIRKAFLETDFERTMMKYVEKWKCRNRKYEFKTEDMMIYKSEEEILFAEVYGHRLILHCTDGEYEMRGTIDDLDRRLPRENFVEPYRGYLVNCRFIEHIENDLLILESGMRIPLSRRKRDEVRKKFLRYMS